MATVRVGTRASRLALAQAELAAEGLRAAGHAPAIVPLSTIGDRDRRRPFAEVGSRGIFASEIEEALADRRIDVAVHSAKDLTGEEPAGLLIGACLERGDPRDAWCGTATSVAAIPRGAAVATASLRRTSQLLRLRPDLRLSSVRGNVETRLRKRSERGLDAVVLAACGLDRLRIADEIGFRFAAEEMIPEAGQGVIALQVREADLALVTSIGHGPTMLALRAERLVTRTLAGGCSVPVAAHAEQLDDRWRVHGYVGTPDGAHTLIEVREHADPLIAAREVAAELLALGGAAIVEAAR